MYTTEILFILLIAYKTNMLIISYSRNLVPNPNFEGDSDSRPLFAPVVLPDASFRKFSQFPYNSVFSPSELISLLEKERITADDTDESMEPKSHRMRGDIKHTKDSKNSKDNFFE